jgi:hypothetical protein
MIPTGEQVSRSSYVRVYHFGQSHFARSDHEPFAFLFRLSYVSAQFWKKTAIIIVSYLSVLLHSIHTHL